MGRVDELHVGQQQGEERAPLSIRAYTPGDLQACLGVFDSNVPRYFRPAERAGFLRFLAALPGPYLVLVAASGDVVACGGYAFVPAEARADLCWGMVRQDLQGSGLGRQLTEARLAHALADPAVRVVALNTSQHTTGFVTTEVVRDGYAPGLHRCEMRLVRAGAPQPGP